MGEERQGRGPGWLLAAVLLSLVVAYFVWGRPESSTGGPEAAVQGAPARPATPPVQPSPDDTPDAGARKAPAQRGVPEGVTLSDDPLVASIERAAWYFHWRELHGDQALLIGAASRGLSDAFASWVGSLRPLPRVAAAAEAGVDPDHPMAGLEGLLWKARTAEHRAWPRLDRPAKLPPRAKSAKLTDAGIEQFVAMMAAVLGCEGAAAPERAKLDGLLAKPGTGYVLTHQLLGVGWARDRHCLDDARTLVLRRTLAPLVYRELIADEDPLNDLSVERAAMLCFVGMCDWLQEERIQQLVAAQKAQGDWGKRPVDVHPLVGFPEGHTAALAFYVLATRWAEHAPGLPTPTPPHYSTSQD